VRVGLLRELDLGRAKYPPGKQARSTPEVAPHGTPMRSVVLAAAAARAAPRAHEMRPTAGLRSLRSRGTMRGILRLPTLPTQGASGQSVLRRSFRTAGRCLGGDGGKVDVANQEIAGGSPEVGLSHCTSRGLGRPHGLSSRLAATWTDRSSFASESIA
jgi:hypothetical protein